MTRRRKSLARAWADLLRPPEKLPAPPPSAPRPTVYALEMAQDQARRLWTWHLEHGGPESAYLFSAAAHCRRGTYEAQLVPEAS
jgi:hypothetical protein